ncbi:MAG: hypothetical protein JETT_2160 [Candidatus Jettenia ecosi]|uniref:Uncharacterized protein n=1 Tax=Candidatus Jettenia ecosi TaxID=2494326 RepID=A0A533QA29_9BACT|nr:MAG: hypothetical protein JETT_2160 [Candidatus Jettenia ecosi]
MGMTNGGLWIKLKNLLKKKFLPYNISIRQPFRVALRN